MAESQHPTHPQGRRRPEDFEASYAGTPPWDIGRPQPVFAELASAGIIRGRVLDVGCGTGEHVLMCAALGLNATGIDAAPTAIAAAKRKATDRGLAARFLVWNALRLSELGETFDTVLDCGLFHVFEDDERPGFVASLRSAMNAGARYHMLCFSDKEPGDWGPRRVTQDEIRSTFAKGWQINSIDRVKLDVLIEPHVVQAWRATITRV